MVNEAGKVNHVDGQGPANDPVLVDCIGDALKNVIVGVATAISALILVLAGPVDWTVVLPLAAGLFTGSLIGPKVARRVPAGILRWLVALVGLGLAAWLWAT